MEIEERRLPRDGHVADCAGNGWNAEVVRVVARCRSRVTDVDAVTLRESDGVQNDRRYGDRFVLTSRVDVVYCAVEGVRHCDDMSGAVGHTVNRIEKDSGPTAAARTRTDAVIEDAVADTPVRRVVAAEEDHRLHGALHGAVDGEVAVIAKARVRR